MGSSPIASTKITGPRVVSSTSLQHPDLVPVFPRAPNDDRAPKRPTRAHGLGLRRHSAPCDRPPQVFAVFKDQTGGRIGYQLEVVLTRSVAPAIGREAGVVLLIGNHIEFGEPNPCGVDAGRTSDLEIESSEGNRIGRRRPSEIDVRTALEVRGYHSVQLPAAYLVGSELDRAVLSRESHAEAARPRHPVGVAQNVVLDVAWLVLEREDDEPLESPVSSLFDQ